MAKRGTAIVVSIIGIALVVSFVGLLALYALFGRGPTVPARSLLVIEVGGELAEQASPDVVSVLRGTRTPTLRSVVEMLHKAKVDDRIAAVLLRPTGFSSPYWAKVQEIRDAVTDFKSSGKPVYAFLDYADERNYYLATAADHVVLMPSATLDLKGVATYALFLRGTFDKLDVVPDMHHIGDYKTAVNTYTEKTYTPAHRQMDEWLNRDLYDQIVRGIAESRKKSDADVRRLIDEGPFIADAALAAGLVDEVAYEDEAIRTLRGENAETMRTLDADDYARVSSTSLGLNRGPRIAVVYASGAIVDGHGGFDPLNGQTVGSADLVKAIRDAAADDSVRAIVLRIDSPGGSATASDAIWHELMVARDRKSSRPLIVSMSDLAASGGYYIAMPGQVIVAQPATLTGSIGIFGGKFVTAGVYEKLGAHIEVTSIGRNAEMASPIRPFNASELAKIEEQLHTFYAGFVEKAAESRHATPEQIDGLGQGRVWTGQQAKQYGLVDELGGLDRAVAIARERAGIPESGSVELVSYPRERSVFDLLRTGFSSSSDRAANAWISSHLSADELNLLRALRGGTSGLFRRGELLALMPVTYLR